MPYFILFLVTLCVTAVFLLAKANKPMSHSQDWIKAGGVLGFAVLLSRLLRLPLATVLTTLPFILPYLRKAEEAQGRSRHAPGSMSKEEARLILGVLAEATAEEIKEAHRRLITKNHPDKGGSDYLAAKVNQARDVLLG